MTAARGAVVTTTAVTRTAVTPIWNAGTISIANRCTARAGPAVTTVGVNLQSTATAIAALTSPATAIAERFPNAMSIGIVRW